jgi:hypothetical protein
MESNKPADPVIRLGLFEILGLAVIGLVVWLYVTGNIKVTNTPAQVYTPPPTATSTAITESDILSLASNQQVDAIKQATPIPIPPELDRQVSTVSLTTTDFSPTGSQPPECEINAGWPQAIQLWCGWITYYAKLNGYDPNWAAAQMWQESRGNPNAQSNKCATGLIQVMPSDGKFVGGYCDLENGTVGAYSTYYGGVFSNRPTMTELRNPEFNLQWGLDYMGALIRDHGSVWEALLYYGGVGYGDQYRGAVKSHYDCIVNQLSTSCTGGLK